MGDKIASFTRLEADKGVAELTRPGTCLGNVYATTKDLPNGGRRCPFCPYRAIEGVLCGSFLRLLAISYWSKLRAKS